MNDLLGALKRLKVNTNSLACLGCGHEHNCSIHGCAIIRAAVEELEKGQWISVKDKLPNTEDEFLVTNARGDMEVSIFGMKEQAFLFFDGYGYAHKRTMVTHWMPLPKPPKEDK